MAAVSLLCHTHDQVGESPLWHAGEQALYWVDIEGRQLRRLDWATRQVSRWPVHERIGSIALHAAGGLVAAMESGIFHLRPGDAGAVEHMLMQAVDFPLPGMRFNDGRCDRQGRFWVSSMLRDMAQARPVGALYCLDAGHWRQVLAEGLVVGNGLAFSPDDRVMWLSDSHASVREIWCLDITAAGQLENRRRFTDLAAVPGRPDGAALDAEGAYWSCANDAGLVHRFMPDGSLQRSIRLPVSKPSMCAFGGPDLDRLFITSIAPASPVPGFDAALDGAVFVCEPGVAGIADSPYQPG